jgi:hypothetical protein
VYPFKLQASLCFSTANQQEFVLTIEAHEDRALFLVEDKFDVAMWRGEFSSAYIEEISRKTGREKNYGQFLACVGTAIKASQ